MRLEPASVTGRLNQALQRHQAAAQGKPVEEQALRDGLRISLSELGRARAAEAQKNSDIDDSDLPASIKQVLKMIRELKAQIAAKQAELDAVLAVQGLDPDAQRAQIEAIQTQLSTLNGALAGANAILIQLLGGQDLSDEQKQAAALLAMA
ncbi:hypothetical protein HP532_11895 [Pseudomonas sp. CrR25]|nr:hypothetical protein [Pseudomonas sp. CrR25]